MRSEYHELIQTIRNSLFVVGCFFIVAVIGCMVIAFAPMKHADAIKWLLVVPGLSIVAACAGYTWWHGYRDLQRYLIVVTGVNYEQLFRTKPTFLYVPLPFWRPNSAFAGTPDEIVSRFNRNQAAVVIEDTKLFDVITRLIEVPFYPRRKWTVARHYESHVVIFAFDDSRDGVEFRLRYC